MSVKGLVSAGLMLLLAASCIPVNVVVNIHLDKEMENKLDKFEGDVRKGASQKEAEKKKGTSPLPNTAHDGFYEQEKQEIKIEELNNPKIRKIKERRSNRFKELRSYFDAGQLGEANNAEVSIRNEEGLDAKKKAQLRKLVKEENEDREEFVKEVAKANKLGESDIPRIRKIYAKVIREKHLEQGWWYQDKEGEWRKKE